MSAREKIAYLKGLIDGQGSAEKSPESVKFYAALADALESLADELENHDKVHGELYSYLEDLDSDVEELEKEVDDIEDDVDALFGDPYDEEDEEPEEDECGCHHHHRRHRHRRGEDFETDFFGDADGEEESGAEALHDSDYRLVKCPECGGELYIEPSLLEEDEEVVCPHCGKTFDSSESEA